MKFNFTFLFFLLGSISVSYSQLSPPEVLFYKFNRTDNKVVNHASNIPVGADTAIIIGGLTQGSGDVCVGALIGTGQASNIDYINTNWVTDLSGDFTISFRTNNITASTTLFYLFGDLSYGSLRLFTNGVAGPDNWIFRGPFSDLLIPGAAVVAPTMTTITYDLTTMNLTGYVNGVYSSSVNTPITLSPVGSTFKLNGYSANVGLPSGGKLEEFRIYSRSLSAAEVLELYNGTSIDYIDSTDFICSSATPLVVKSNVNMEKYLWNTGETTDSILVNTSGLYKVNAILDCVTYADSIIVQQSYNYGPNLDIEICQFDFPYTSPFGEIFHAPGTHTIIGTNSTGCDSVVTLNLSVNATTFDTLVNRTGASLEEFSATAGLDSYQWYDCISGTPIAGETNAQFIATSNGSYAVLLEQNFCTFMSQCFDVYTLSNEAYQIFEIKAFPNPSNGLFNIEVPKQFSSEFDLNIYSITGQKIQTKNYASISNLQVELHVEKGLYFIELKDKAGNMARGQIIKN